jgi:geranylgeranyl pyrophosphate synthase
MEAFSINSLITERIIELTETQPSGIPELLQHLLNTKAKMLRPTLTFLAAGVDLADERVWQEVPARLVDAGAAIELVHISSLYHDDIIDSDDFRRGVSSANAEFGVPKALIAGDFLFALALDLAVNLSFASVRILTEAFRKMCYGQMFEITRTVETLDQYYELIDHKTVQLMISAVKLGLELNENGENESDAWSEFTFNFGRAFQLADDRRDNAEVLERVGADWAEFESYSSRARRAAGRFSNPRLTETLQTLIAQLK